MTKDIDYGSYPEADDSSEDSSESKLSPSLMMLAEKLGFDESKAQALKDFIEECSSSDYSGSSEQDDQE